MNRVLRREPSGDRVLGTVHVSRVPPTDATDAGLCMAREILQPVSQASAARTCPSQGNFQGLTTSTMRPAKAWSSEATFGHEGANVRPAYQINTYDAQKDRQSLPLYQKAERGVTGHGLHLSPADTAATLQGQERSANYPEPSTRDTRMLPTTSSIR